MNAIRKMTMGAGLVCVFFHAVVTDAHTWAPIDPDEIKIISEPKAPGTSAILLDRFVGRDYDKDEEIIYQRIKILAESGLKYADIEIPYVNRRENIHDFAARVVKPDGTIKEFSGAVLQAAVVQSHGLKILKKMVPLPSVQVGDVVEYRYHKYIRYQADRADYQWIISQGIFTRHAKFEIRTKFPHSMHISWPAGLPPGASKPIIGDETIQMEVRDVPAFEAEDCMPPENQIKYRVDFVYHDSGLATGNQVEFWNEIARRMQAEVNDMLGPHRDMERRVASLVASQDVPEIKLRKLYSHVQRLRNLSFDHDKIELEIDLNHLGTIKKITDIEKYGYADSFRLTCLFLALVHAAGFEADLVMIATRDKYFFDASTMNPNQLTGSVVVVKTEGKTIFLDPGNPYVPFGMLPWYESGVMGLRIRQTGMDWVTIPVLPASASTVSRDATIKLSPGGTATGEVIVTYTGLEAITRRMDTASMDSVSKNQILERELQLSLDGNGVVHVIESEGWDAIDQPLVAKFAVTISDWLSMTGNRIFLHQGLFGNYERHVFESRIRQYPVYFHYPSRTYDKISLEYPSTCTIRQMPRAAENTLGVVAYSEGTEQAGGHLELARELVINSILVDIKYYLALHDFFDELRVADTESAVLECRALQ